MSLTRESLWTLVVFLPSLGAAQSLPERTAEEVFRIGGVDPPEYAQFIQEPGLAVTSDGTLFVRSDTPPFVAMFDGAGNHVRTIGREGDGPGEFRTATAHGWVADTLWIINWVPPRISRFRFDGTHVSTVRLEPIDYGGPLSGPQSITALLGSGRAIAVTDVRRVGGDARSRLPVYVGDTGFQERRLVAEVVRPQRMRIQGVGTFGMSPFPIPPIVTVGGDGSGFLVADWSESDPGTLQLTRFSSAGDTQWSRSLDLGTDPVPSALRDSLVERGMEMAASQIDRARAQGQIGNQSVESLVREGLYIPDSFPPADRVVLGADNSVWLRRPSVEPEVDWLVLDSNGNPVFRVALPASVTVKAATQGSAWGTEVDELEIPYVVRFDLR